ncbi:hypothetical protein GCM10022216_25200 [Sphingobacterium kyonggiense]|uniref:Uncharacterized protein n=1 Tax=Sphingobacterium kyonggiense TaxID=714075 RepID=A0ABP7YY54_9SPHI
MIQGLSNKFCFYRINELIVKKLENESKSLNKNLEFCSNFSHKFHTLNEKLENGSFHF